MNCETPKKSQVSDYIAKPDTKFLSDPKILKESISILRKGDETYDGIGGYARLRKGPQKEMHAIAKASHEKVAQNIPRRLPENFREPNRARMVR